MGGSALVPFLLSSCLPWCMLLPANLKALEVRPTRFRIRFSLLAANRASLPFHPVTDHRSYSQHLSLFPPRCDPDSRLAL